MSRRIRTILVVACALVALVSGVSLGILRSGRPLFYTDGTTPIRADVLADRSMLVWDSPEVRFEIPGAVRGRVARLPDGRVLFARVLEDETTDLYTFDPARPELEPVAVAVLNAPGRHDLAPSTVVDGTVYFASDRPGGRGGFDLYAAPYVDGRFLPPVAVDERFNSEVDELDPAPHPLGGGLAFVRGFGDGSSLWFGGYDGTPDPAPMFESRDGDDVVTDRDPSFAPDGTAVWFARQAAGGPATIWRTWSHEGRFVEPVAETALGRSRGPVPIRDGFAVEIVRHGDTTLIYEARAREVYPWWEGQAWIEQLLWFALAIALLLIALLLLGNRWRQLDIITWCILVSILLHLLILMIVGGLALEREPLDEDDDDRLEITFVSSADAAAAGGRSSDVHREIAFAGREFTPEIETPEASLGARDAATLDVGEGVRAAVTEPVEASAPAAMSVADAVEVGAPSSGRDAARASATAAEVSAAEIAASARSVERLDRTGPSLAIDVPASANLRAAMVGSTRTRGPVGERLAAVDPSTARAAPQVSSVRDSVRPIETSKADDAGRTSSSLRTSDAMSPSKLSAELRAMRPASGGSKIRAARPSTSLDVPAARGGLRVAATTRQVATARSDTPNLTATELRDEREIPRVAAANRGGETGRRSPSTMRRVDARPASAALHVARPSRAGSPASLPLPRPSSFLARAAKPRPNRTVAVSKARSPEIYQNRAGPARQRALERFGGSAETEAAVANGLRYLASIQSRSGHWGRTRFDHNKYGSTWVGKSGLCVLAFLGGGHTHRSSTEYSDHVGRALRALVASQDDRTGHFGRTSSYSHGIATYALAECYAMTKDETLRAPLEKAVAWILKQQNHKPDPRSNGGWGYFSAGLRPEDHYARTSVSAWMIMALKSAQIGGLPVPQGALDDAVAFLWRMFDEDHGYVLYSKQPSRLRSSSMRTLPASTPGALFCLLLMGERQDDRTDMALEFTVSRKPKRYRSSSVNRFVSRGEGNVYFWYYGSLATLLAGGEAWDEWNQSLKDVLVPAQNSDGSWTPVGAYTSHADENRNDRSYTTAMVVLSLEVYYRYFTPLLRRD